jgi:hypothetical protein
MRHMAQRASAAEDRNRSHPPVRMNAFDIFPKTVESGPVTLAPE